MTSHVLMCERQFVPAILSGTKPHTIRGKRQRAIQPGDRLDLRAWIGKPYRSKVEKLRVVTCSRVRAIRIWSKLKEGNGTVRVEVDGVPAKPDVQMALIRADGFASAYDFGRFFQHHHGEEFVGQLIEWTP